MDSVITLNLSRFFNDERSCVKIHIDEKFKTVNDLEKYIKKLFAIKTKMCLLDTTTLPYCLLPRSENINLIRGIKSHVLAVPVSFKICKNVNQTPVQEVNLKNGFQEAKTMEVCNEDKNEYKSFESIKNIVASTPADVFSTKLDKQNKIKSNVKIDEIYNDEVTNKPSRKTVLHQISKISDNTISKLSNGIADQDKEINHKESFSVVESCANNKPECIERINNESDINPIIQTIETVNFSTNEIAEMQNQLPNNTIHSTGGNKNVDDDKEVSYQHITTRGRKRIRKRKSKNLTGFVNEKDIADMNSDCCVQNTSMSVKSTPSHIRFSETDEFKAIDINTSSSDVFESDEISKKPKIIEDVEKSMKQKSIVQNNDGIKTTWQKLYEEFIPQNYKSLSMLPAMGDVIACKILRMTSTYEPELSSYIFALVINVVANDHIQNADLTLEILVGSEFLQEPKGKFQLLDEEQNEATPSEVKTITLKWHNIYDPKFILK